MSISSGDHSSPDPDEISIAQYNYPTKIMYNKLPKALNKGFKAHRHRAVHSKQTSPGLGSVVF